MTHRRPAAPQLLLAMLVLLAAAGCASRGAVSMQAPTPDPRIGLSPGMTDAGQAAWNLTLVAHAPRPPEFTNPAAVGGLNLANSDLAFGGSYVFQGNFHGFQIWDASTPSRLRLVTTYICPGSQGDVSVYRNLLFVSVEAFNGRADCGTAGVADSVSTVRARGIRIFDVTDVTRPRPLALVQTCRGSHTHTLVTTPRDTANVYIYISGSATVRSPNELAGCSRLPPDQDPNSSLYRIDVIQVPLAAPERSRVVSSPRIFTDLGPAPRHGEPVDSATLARRRAQAANALGGPAGPAGPARPQVRSGPSQCHDITVYPAIARAGGACGGYGLLLDISDVMNPVRIGAASDSNMAFWHSATFNNDGTGILFSDEWGGGTQPRCRATDRREWGANALFTLQRDVMTFRSYYKLAPPQTAQENCVAHNGSLIPVPGRDIMVQGWYQGGISVFDWTDPAHPVEIAFFDRGPLDSARLLTGGSWSAYWYNGSIYSSEIARGLDVFALTPSAFLTANELEAARSARLDVLNVQSQPHYEWPASFAVARAYVDQLERGGMARDRIRALRRDLTGAESASGDARRQALTRLAGDAEGLGDGAAARGLAGVLRDLAGAR